MGVLTICSGKSTGVTTLSVAVAAGMPGPAPVLLVEADPAGGDLAARFNLPPAPGLASAAAAASGLDGPRFPAAHAQRLPVGVGALLCASSYRQASASVTHAASSGLLTAWGRDAVVVVDVGRLDAGSPAFPIAAASNVVLLVLRPRWDEAAHAAATVAALREARVDNVGVVLVGDGPLSAKSIGRDLGVLVVLQTRQDRWGAKVFGGELPPGPGWRRLSLARAGRSVAVALHHRLCPPPAAAVGAAGWAAVTRR
ncbi:hypothetical protein GCM10023322_68630 [Rugosimonospora acidiphila]|uniref:MinD-like ATPase involved in chromosome partitioning or flagellar assembly n=1 Tax=Rugosimonospora acidiphila TaxID=556531 RepID=A0ABP9SL75_9ACTN